MPKLYVAKGACSLGAHVVLKELGIAHEIVKVPLRQPDSPIFKVNPLGRVPTLVTDEGEVITENAAILPYLADLKPQAGLIAAAGSVERARIQEWIGLVNSDLHPAFRTVNRPNLFHPDEAQFPAVRAQGLTRLRDLLSAIQRRLEGKTWAVGERFTAADAYLGVFIGWLPRAGIDAAKEYPGLAAYGDRYHARSAVKAALALENTD